MNVTATLFGQILAFAAMIWFIRAFLWDPMLNMMENRRKRIADGLADAEKGRREREEADQYFQQRKDEARQEASDLINQAQRRASEIVDQAKNNAREEGERIKAAAQDDIDQEINRAREALRRQVGAIAVAGAEKVLGREIDAKAHSAVLDDLVAQI